MRIYQKRNRHAVAKLVLAAALFLAALLAWPGAAEGRPNNTLYVGVSLNLSTGARPDLGSMRPWIKAHIDGSTPNGVNRFRAREMHHAYVGAVLLATGQLVHSRTLRVAGGILIIDDAAQHVLRIDSPVHRISDELYKYDWYKKLVSLGDKLAGQDR